MNALGRGGPKRRLQSDRVAALLETPRRTSASVGLVLLLFVLGACVVALAACGDEACGDHHCGSGESASNCPFDCEGLVCGDGICQPGVGENVYNCTADCGGPGPVCGNGECELNETYSNCNEDCPNPYSDLCGNGRCDPLENSTSCPEDCGNDAPDADTTDTSDPDTGDPAVFVRIEPGTFTMGSPVDEEGRYDNETQHEVTITRAFLLQSTEVTQGQWRDVMGDNPSHFSSCGDDCPVEDVSWANAVAYVNALSASEGLAACYSGSTFTGLDCEGYRLPTEAEWEYAARAGTSGARYGDLDDVAWHYGNSGPADSPRRTHAVGGLAPNAWGLYDMLGNVWEWTGDWYGEYPAGSVSDPLGPAEGSYRVFRGGSWFIGLARYVRAAYRSSDSPALRYDSLGFRPARTVTE